MKRVDYLLKNVVRNLGIEDGVRLAGIKSDWHILFHEPLSFHMMPVGLSGNELLLNVDSSVWLQELKFYKQDIARKLGAYGVRDVKFRLGRVKGATNTGAGKMHAGTRTFSEKERSCVEETVSRLGDDTLKTAVRTAMEKAVLSGKTKIR